MIRNTQPTTSNRANGGSESPSVCAAASSMPRERERINRAVAASNQLTEYSTRMCARRTETEAKSYSDAANVGTLYGGRYQRILLDSAANAACVARGRLAYFLKETSIAGTSPFYIVTDISHALSADLIAGVLD